MPERSGEPRRDTKESRSTRSRFVKVSRRPEDDERIRREAALLKTLRHPGILTFVAADTAAFPNVLITERVDGPSLAEAGPLSADDISRVLDAVNATLDDLHRVGVVHAAVAPEHILLPGKGQPVLCSFGYAGRIGDPAPPLPPSVAEFADPSRMETGLVPGIDGYALDAVGRWLTGAVPVGAVPLIGPPPSPPFGPDPGGRRRLALVVAVVGGAALLVAVAFWGMTSRSGADRPRPHPGLTTTSRPPSATGDRAGAASLPTDVARTWPPEPAQPAGGADDALSGVDGVSGAGPVQPSRPEKAVAHSLSAVEPAEALPADVELPGPPEVSEAAAPASGAETGGLPVMSSPAALPPRARVSSGAEPSAPRSQAGQPPAAVALPVPPTALPPGSLPAPATLSPASVSPAVSLPLPDSLPATVTFPDPVTLVPPVVLLDESTLVPPVSPAEGAAS